MNSTEEVDPGQLAEDGDIAGALRALDKSLSGIAARMDRKFARNLTVMSCLLIVVSVLAFSVWTTHGDARHASRSAVRAKVALVTYIAEAQKARVASCTNSNLSELKQASAEKIESHDFVAALTAGSSDPNIQQRADEFNKSHDALITGAHALRDCSPEGIAKFLNQSQPSKETP